MSAFDDSSRKTRPSAIVKGFGCILASESARGTNLCCCSMWLWEFRLGAWFAGVSGLAARASGVADTSAWLGSGCTSGHGVCGMSRLSPRSLVATALFMASGFATVALLRLGGFL